MSFTKAEILEGLIDFSLPLELVKKALTLMEFDDGETVMLSAEQMQLTLEKFINSEIKREDLEEWAVFIESREDIEKSEKVTDIIFQLANKMITQTFIDKPSARKMIEYLSS